MMKKKKKKKKATTTTTTGGGEAGGAAEEPRLSSPSPPQPQPLVKFAMMKIGPLPNFTARWRDGSTLRYLFRRVGDFSLGVSLPNGAAFAFRSASTVPRYVPGLTDGHIATTQRALEHCLDLELRASAADYDEDGEGCGGGGGSDDDLPLVVCAPEAQFAANDGGSVVVVP